MGNGFNLPGGAGGFQTDEPYRVPPAWTPPPPPRRKVLLPSLLLLLTIFSTLAVGAHLSRAYEQNQPPFPDDLSLFGVIGEAAANPGLLLNGWPFALTLLGILGMHELGHFFAARHHGIHATYPYFIPFPNLIGTLGAFIRIQSPIVDRRALFDVGVSGPLVGFVVALPALALGILNSRVLPESTNPGAIVFGNPPLIWLAAKLLRPEVSPDELFLNPMARAAWVGLFATALNLLPVGQLDGGHILYSVSSRLHKSFSRLFLFLLLGAGTFGVFHPETIWPGWLFWGGLLLAIGMRHPAVLDPGRELDTRRRQLAVVSLLIFLLCFTPVPFHIP